MAKTVFSDLIRSGVRHRGGNCCEFCKSQDKFSPVLFTLDHAFPLSEGGTNDFENLIYCCSLCNRLK
jgi:5-methylcytosine-specific restriction endonuclease McrA